MILNLDATVYKIGWVIQQTTSHLLLSSFAILFQTEPLSEELAVNGTSYRGEIIVALKFLPPNSSSHSSKKLGRRSSNSKGTLLILVKEAKNLVSPKGTNIPDPFCKGYVHVY